MKLHIFDVMTELALKSVAYGLHTGERQRRRHLRILV